MSYYNEPPQWAAPGRQPSWEQPPPPSRSGSSFGLDPMLGRGGDRRSGASSTVPQGETTAFGSQFEEIDRAADNLMKSGKMFAGMGPMGGMGPGMTAAAGGLPQGPRRDSMPSMAGRGFPDVDPRMGGPQRHHSISEYDGMRTGSANNLQGYYASQRYGPRAGGEPDQMMQAKRRMAAQRERELRNYHQEQQYNRNISGGKSDRSLSPNMSEEERRELIARQHRALYGDNSSLYANDGTRTSSQDARVAAAVAGARGASPLAFDPFGTQAHSNADGAVQMPPRDNMPSKDVTAGAQRSRANSNSSPSSNPTASVFYDQAQQSSRTSNSSPGGSPPRQGSKAPPVPGVAPIGTRPMQNPAHAAAGKRSTTPNPSPLSYGFSASGPNNMNERSTSAASNPPSSVADKGVSLGWGNSNPNVWGSSKNGLGVQASVWG